MNLDELKKLSGEEKKKLVLFVILGFTAVYAVFTLVITPFIQGNRRSAMDLDTLHRDLDRAQRMVSREAHIRETANTISEELREASRQHIPPMDNPLSWVAGKVYGSARKVGLDIESVADVGGSLPPWSEDEESQRAFVPYTVRIVTECGYAQLVNLVRVMEEENPYLTVSDIQVMGQDDEPLRHRVRISVQWPFWVAPIGENDAVTGAGSEEVQHG